MLLRFAGKPMGHDFFEHSVGASLQAVGTLSGGVFHGSVVVARKPLMAYTV